MDSSERFSKLLAEFDSNPDFVLDDVLTDLTERIDALMAEKGITRTELARRMGVKPPVITRLLSGTENTTLKTLLRVAFALDTVLDVELGKPEAIAARRKARRGVMTTAPSVGRAPPWPTCWAPKVT